MGRNRASLRLRAAVALRLVRIGLRLAPGDEETHWLALRQSAARATDCERLARRVRAPHWGEVTRYMQADVNDREAPDGATVIRQPKRAAIPPPQSAVERLIEHAKLTHGEGFVRSWLSATTCLFEPAIVWTHDFGADTLRAHCAILLEHYGVAVEVDDQSRAYFRQRTLEIAAQHPVRRKKRRSVGAR